MLSGAEEVTIEFKVWKTISMMTYVSIKKSFKYLIPLKKDHWIKKLKNTASADWRAELKWRALTENYVYFM